jgi:hypothetical protein
VRAEPISVAAPLDREEIVAVPASATGRFEIEPARLSGPAGMAGACVPVDRALAAEGELTHAVVMRVACA